MGFFFETTKAPLIFNLFIMVTSRSSIRCDQGNELISWRGSHAWADLLLTDSLSHQYKTTPLLLIEAHRPGVLVGSLLRIQDFSAPPLPPVTQLHPIFSWRCPQPYIPAQWQEITIPLLYKQETEVRREGESEGRIHYIPGDMCDRYPGLSDVGGFVKSLLFSN